MSACGKTSVRWWKGQFRRMWHQILLAHSVVPVGACPDMLSSVRVVSVVRVTHTKALRDPST